VIFCDTDTLQHKGNLSKEVESMRTKMLDKCIKNEMEEEMRKDLKEIRDECMELRQDVTECKTDIAVNKQNNTDNTQNIADNVIFCDTDKLQQIGCF
jgi:peroxiredoxin family protein